jgi:hypothetical protein
MKWLFIGSIPGALGSIKDAFAKTRCAKFAAFNDSAAFRGERHKFSLGSPDHRQSLAGYPPHHTTQLPQSTATGTQNARYPGYSAGNRPGVSRSDLAILTHGRASPRNSPQCYGSDGSNPAVIGSYRF